MRFAIVFTLAAAVVSASASLVVRQTPPACYYTCAEAETTDCNPTDASCLCKDASFVAGTTKCIQQTCKGADLTAALSAGDQSCLAVGITLSSSSTEAASSTASSTGTTPVLAASSSTSSPSASASASTSTSAATAHGVNAFIGFAAVGIVAFAL